MNPEPVTPSAPSPSSSLAPEPVKLRLMIAAQPKSWRKGKRLRDQAEEADVEACSDKGRERERPTRKIKLRTGAHYTSEEPGDTSTASSSFTLSGQFFSSTTIDVSTAPSRVAEADARSSTSSIEVPAAKRPRSHSNSSIVGLLVSEDEAPSPPTDVAVSPSRSVRTASPGPSTNKHHPTHAHVSSPLASAPITGVPLEPSSRSSGSTHSPRDGEMLSGPVPVNEGNPNPNPNPNPRTQLAKARAKFLAEVEALGTELNHVFKLGYGRGLGRSTGGVRGPSRLSRNMSEKGEQEGGGEADMDMDMDMELDE